MCELLPEFENCCGCWSLRMGCLFIAILGIMTGSSSLSGLYHQAKWDFKQVNSTDVTGIFKRNALKWIPEFVERSHLLAPLGVAVISVVFMIMGVILFYSALFDREDVMTLPIWGLFINVILGLVLVSGVSVQCFLTETCIFGSIDWISQCIIVLAIVGYLIVWYYFCAVANSYVLSKYD